ESYEYLEQIEWQSPYLKFLTPFPGNTATSVTLELLEAASGRDIWTGRQLSPNERRELLVNAKKEIGREIARRVLERGIEEFAEYSLDRLYESARPVAPSGTPIPERAIIRTSPERPPYELPFKTKPTPDPYDISGSSAKLTGTVAPGEVPGGIIAEYHGLT